MLRALINVLKYNFYELKAMNFIRRKVHNNIDKIQDKGTFELYGVPLAPDVFENNTIFLAIFKKEPFIVYKRPEWSIAIGYDGYYFFESDNELTFMRNSKFVPDSYKYEMLKLIYKNRDFLEKLSKDMLEEDINVRYAH